MGQWCGTVGRAVASNTRGPRFESSHRQILDKLSVNCIEKTKKWKEAGNGPFLTFLGMYMLFLYYRCATFCGKNTNRYFGLLAGVNWTIFLFCYFKGLKHETDLLPKVMQQIKRRSFSNLFECFSSVTRHTCKISWENVFESSKFATTAVAVVVVVKLEENCFCRKDNLIYQMQTNRN